MAIVDFIARIPGFGKRDRLIGLTDQGLQSLVKFVGLIAFARWMTVEEFAAISLAMAIMYVLTGLQRSSIVFTFIVACPDVETVEADGWKWGWLNMATAGAATVLLALLTLISSTFNAPGWFTSAVAFSTVLSAPSLLYDFARRWLYQGRRYRAVLWMSLTFVGLYAVGIAAVHQVDGIQGWVATISFAGASLMGTAVAMVGGARLRWPTWSVFGIWYSKRSFAAWSSLSFVVGSVYQHGMTLLVAGLAGSVSVAAYSATRNLAAPIVTLVAGIDMIDKPRAGRAYKSVGMSGLVRSIKGTSRFIVALGTPYLLVLFFVAGPALEFCYGDKYAAYASVLRLWVVVHFIGLLVQPLNTFLITLQASRAIFMTRIIGTTVTLITAFVLVPTQGPDGALIAVIAGRSVDLVCLIVFIRQILRDHRKKIGSSTPSA
ncbi:MAG: lipopolysaccharide biosynthesis protein [Inquilinaceae bacterium]